MENDNDFKYNFEEEHISKILYFSRNNHHFKRFVKNRFHPLIQQ